MAIKNSLGFLTAPAGLASLSEVAPAESLASSGGADYTEASNAPARLSRLCIRRGVRWIGWMVSALARYENACGPCARDGGQMCARIRAAGRRCPFAIARRGCRAGLLDGAHRQRSRDTPARRAPAPAPGPERLRRGASTHAGVSSGACRLGR